MKEVEITLMDGTVKKFTNEDVKTISTWDDTKEDEPERYLYFMNLNSNIGKVGLPFLYYKDSMNTEVPISTQVTLEQFAG